MTFEEVIHKNGKLIYTNVGRSMLPLIREGKDVMVIEQITEPLKVNDAVLFIRPGVEGRGRYVLHRIRRINSDNSYYIVGDNCIKGERVAEENIIGILTRVDRANRTIYSSDFSYRVFVKIWWFIYPLRVFLKRCRGFAGRCKRRLYGSRVKI